MILIDSCARAKFLRETGSPACDHVGKLLGEEFAVCDAVRMEVLAGARNERHLSNLRRLLAQALAVPTVPEDHEEVAALHCLCRHRGETVRNLMDCLIAVIAIRAGASVFHCDNDFNVLARHTPLRIAGF